ncbi:hypothetical protein [Halosolutus gelatinilyticus]|uniref:hypothetical protein n=1 Tax=Halosolutus gelatinilyticus TaxID=2931975 RepID=UPI001FF26B4E|nr:hypothetical protein [Halosolutus gelatinilyticus]
MTARATSRMEAIPRWRRSAATGILVLAALGALYAFVAAIPTVRAASPETVVVESWRLFGFLVFAGLFLLLAYRPDQYPGVWELVIFHKAALAVYLAGFGTDAVDGPAVAATDGALAIALVVAYLLVEGYRNWDRLRKSAA